jgi:hypothetical protein
MRVTAPEDGPVEPPVSRRWTIAMLVAASLALVGVVVVSQNLLLGDRGKQAAPARPLTAEEATRLATMRQLNWRDARAGVRATIGQGAEQIHVAGWVDWQHPMVYLARSGATPGVITELVQAVPGIVAVRPGEIAPPEPVETARPEIIDPHPAPPPEPPADGWQLRRPGAEGPAGAATAPGTIDALAVLLLTIAAEDPDAAELLAETESQWLRRDRTAGYEVDVLLGPAIPPSPPPPGPPAPGRALPESLAAMGGAVQYWLDDQARLHRLEALLAADTPVRVDLARDDQTAPAVLDLLGGARVDPRSVTNQQGDALSQLRQRNRAAGGGEVTLTVPTEDGGTITGAGWLDWQRTIAYLATSERSSEASDAVGGTVDRPAGTGLLWADGTGIATRTGEPAEDGRPPLPVPEDGGWERSPWEGRGDDQGGYDLDLLLNEALSLSDWNRDDLEQLRETAVWLRGDELAGSPVTVYEIPRSIESEVAPGEARLRYWVDDDAGVLRRLEIRTRSGGFGQLDLNPGPLPAF